MEEEKKEERENLADSLCPFMSYYGVDILADWAKQRGGKDNAIHAGGAG